MAMDSFSVRYYGFRPTSEIQILFKDYLEKLCEVAPNEATMHATIHRGNDLFWGLVRIQSPVGEFVARASALNAEKLVQKLYVQMTHSLARWKTKRFERARL